ncbi:peritrophin-1-like [Homarus americanus]|uniref:peritrophin-1-like n=1 Tax=Homarus americanus TaxID=6706 RepID=UPI001C4578BE|nr:peritrophin-1-like [Homarus americanus]
MKHILLVSVCVVMVARVSHGHPAYLTAGPDVSSQCPSPPREHPFLLPNPTDCSSFYMCTWDSIAILQHCPLHLQFNPTLQVCDYPAHFSCVVSTTPAPVYNATTPAPVSNVTTPAPVSNATTPTPVSNATTPAPVSNTTTPAPVSNTTTPAPVSNTTTPQTPLSRKRLEKVN